MKTKAITTIMITLFLANIIAIAVPVRAIPTTWTVDDDKVECPSAVFTHPQDAVNAANPGDTILVYPGTYDSRVYTTKPPHYSLNDQYAPALIVWKNDLTIEAANPDPATTIIQSTHNYWSNPVAIQASTGGTWDGTKYVGAGVYPVDGTAPNAIAVVASGVTIHGFTLKRHFEGTWATYNTAGVMIGGLYAGDTQFPGQANDNIVEDCVFEDVWHAVYIWHSSGNIIRNNIVGSLSTNHWAAISTYDGYTNDQINLPNPSENNLICHNVLANKGIALGAWAPEIWTSVACSKVCCNTATQIGVTYAHGPVMIGCNLAPGGGSSGFWQYNTDKVIRIKGISYTGDHDVEPAGLIDFAAQLDYDGSSDGSGIEVEFIYDGTTVSTTTSTGGTASYQVTLGPGVYTITAKVTVCPCCIFTDSYFLAIYDPTAGFVTGGGWIISPEGAYTADSTLTGKATFGFVSKYQKGAITPTGQTEFQFQIADFKFHSTSYEWLVVAGARAQYKGSGTINGVGDYGFMLTAIDGQINGGGGLDKFRIKIWDRKTEAVIYDNQIDAPDTADPTTAIAGGSIVIHTK